MTMSLEEPFPGVNCANIIESLCEEMFEDAADQFGRGGSIRRGL